MTLVNVIDFTLTCKILNVFMIYWNVGIKHISMIYWNVGVKHISDLAVQQSTTYTGSDAEVSRQSTNHSCSQGLQLKNAMNLNNTENKRVYMCKNKL